VTREGASGGSLRWSTKPSESKASSRLLKPRASWRAAADPYPSVRPGVVTPALVRSSVFLPGEASGLPPTGGSHRGTKDEMTTRPEESDGCVVPEGARKDAPTAAMRGGKATTASEVAGHLRLSLRDSCKPARGRC
jgi:hypothetical protein